MEILDLDYHQTVVSLPSLSSKLYENHFIIFFKDIRPWWRVQFDQSIKKTSKGLQMIHEFIVTHDKFDSLLIKVLQGLLRLPSEKSSPSSTL